MACTYKTTVLPNGVTVATARMPHMSSATIGIWIATGGRFETEPQNGASHFIEHMLFKGTKKRSAVQISQSIEGIGGYLNAFTSEEATCYYSRAHHERLPVLVDVLFDMIVNSKFDPVELEKERQVIKEEVAMYQDQPQHLVQELLGQLCWPDQPLGRPLTGTLAALDNLTRERLLGYKQDSYVSGATFVTASGQVEHSQFVALVSKYASRITQGQRSKAPSADAKQSAPRFHHHIKEIEQTQLALAIRTFSRHEEARFILRILNAVLGENMSSRLFQKVREQRGLAYSIYSSSSALDDVGLLTISAGLDTKRLPEAVKVILAELKSFAEKAPSNSEVKRARDYVIGQLDLSLESTESQMTWLSEGLIGHGRIIKSDQVKEKLAGVSGSQIRKLAQTLFVPERMNLSLVGPEGDAATVRKLMGLPNK